MKLPFVIVLIKEKKERRRPLAEITRSLLRLHESSQGGKGKYHLQAVNLLQIRRVTARHRRHHCQRKREGGLRKRRLREESQQAQKWKNKEKTDSEREDLPKRLEGPSQ